MAMDRRGRARRVHDRLRRDCRFHALYPTTGFQDFRHLSDRIGQPASSPIVDAVLSRGANRIPAVAEEAVTQPAPSLLIARMTVIEQRESPC